MSINGTDIVNMLNDQPRTKGTYNLARVANYLYEDPKHILMPAFKNKRYALMKVNVYKGTSEEIAIGGRGTGAILADKNGNPKIRIDYKRSTPTMKLFSFDKNGDWAYFDTIDVGQLIEDEGDGDLTNFINIDSKGKLVYRKLNEETGFYEFLTRSLEKDDVKVLVSHPNKDVYRLIYDGSGVTIIGYLTEEEFLNSYYFDENRQGVYDAIRKQLPNQNFSLYSFSDNYTKGYVKTFGRDNPGAFFYYENGKPKLEFYQLSNKDIKIEQLGLPASVTVSSRDDLKINTYLLFPPGYDPSSKKSLPTIMMPHGGPRARDREVFDPIAQFLATRGYLVVQPNFRGSTGYGYEFEKAGFKQWGLKMQDDITDVTNFLIEQKYIDKNNVCIFGISYGGYAALMAGVKTPELFKCIVSINGVTHLPDLIKYDLRSAAHKELLEPYLYKTIGHLKDDIDMLNANSPALHANKIKAPVLLVGGTWDGVVPYEQQEKMKKALKKAGNKPWFFELEDGGHNVFRHYESAEDIAKFIERFLKKNLQ